jgi:hypothetical protein
MSLKVTDALAGPLPGQHVLRVECQVCRKYYEGDYIPPGHQRERRRVMQWIAEQCAEQLRVAGCPHAEDAVLDLPT